VEVADWLHTVRLGAVLEIVTITIGILLLIKLKLELKDQIFQKIP
jgi:hypothetical protein